MRLLKAFTRMLRSAQEARDSKQKEFIDKPQACTEGATHGISKLPCKDEVQLAMVDHGMCNTPDARSAVSKKRLDLQLHSFMSDMDSIELQQAGVSYASDHEGEQWRHSGELFESSHDSKRDGSIAHYLLSTHNTEIEETHCHLTPQNRAATALPTTQDQSLYHHSHVLLGGNAQPALSSISAGQSSVTRNASSVLESTNKVMAEQVPLQIHKEPKASNVLAVSTAMPCAMARSVWGIKDYELSKQLHNGSTRKVFSATCKASGMKVVLKVFKLDKICAHQRLQLFREIRIHSALQHQNIVQFYCAFMEERCVVIVHEFVSGGDLLHYISKMGGRLTEKAAVHLVLQPLLCALHTQGIQHARDITPEKCLLTNGLVLKVADFGTAVSYDGEQANMFASHQAVPGVARPGKTMDSWAVGAFAYKLLCGMPPFNGNQAKGTAHNIISSCAHFPEDLSPGAVDFITSCFEPHPEKCLTVTQMLNHPWIKMYELTSWQHLCVMTRSHPNWKLPLAGVKGPCHQASAATVNYHKQPTASNHDPSLEVPNVQKGTAAQHVKLNHHLNTTW